MCTAVGALDASALLNFERAGHCTARGLLPRSLIEQSLPAIDRAYAKQQLAECPLEKRLLARVEGRHGLARHQRPCAYHTDRRRHWRRRR